MRTYNVTMEEMKLACEVYANRNTLKGEKAFYKLAESIMKRNGEDEILHDLAFEFDEFKMTDEINALCIKYDWQ